MSDGSTTQAGTANPEAPNPQLPIQQRLRIRYAKRGRLRFTSHRDFGRAFERAIRRARVPIAYSSGFTPHPKISYAGASPTGAASEAEFLEIGVTRALDPDRVRDALNESMPDGFVVLDVVVSPGGALADLLEASHWSIQLPGVSPAQAQSAVEKFVACDEILVERMMKRGLRTFDCRGAVRSLALDVASSRESCAILDVVVRHDTPSVRPDDVLVGLRSEGGLVAEQTPIATRLAQGPFDPEANTVGDPLALRRDARKC